MHIALKPCRSLHEMYCRIHHSDLSFSTFIVLKPCYITSPTRVEMEMCLCSKCLNPHCIYRAIRNEVNKDVPLSYSLTEFLSKDMKCAKEIGFYSLKCILGNSVCPRETV